MLEPVMVIIGLPIVLAWLAYEWFKFELVESIRIKVARLRSRDYN